jgi:hypothetical protein
VYSVGTLFAHSSTHAPHPNTHIPTHPPYPSLHDLDPLVARGDAISSVLYGLQLQLDGVGGDTSDPAFVRQLTALQDTYDDVYYMQSGSSSAGELAALNLVKTVLRILGTLIHCCPCLLPLSVLGSTPFALSLPLFIPSGHAPR